MLPFKKLSRCLRIYFAILLGIMASFSTHSKDWDGETYQKNSQPQQNFAEKILTTITFPKEKIFRVLDVGCGDGNVAVKYIIPLSHASHFVGLEPNKSMINLAKENLPNNKDVSFVNCKIEDFNSPEDLFDCVTSFMTLHWVSPNNKDKAFENISNALKPGSGLFIALFVIGSDKPRLQTAKNFVTATEKWQTFFKDFVDPIDLAAPETIQNLLKKHNFETKRFNIHETVVTFKNDEAFYNWINGFSQFKELLKDRHKEFWLEILQKYRELTNQSSEEESIKYVDYMLEIVAIKN